MSVLKIQTQSITVCRTLFQEGVTAIKKMVKIGNSQNTWESCGIPQMSGNLDNFPNGWKSGNFAKFLKYLNVFYFSIKGNFYFRNFQKYTQSPIRIKEIPFSQCLGIWEISKMPGNLGNFPNSLENLMVISQMHSYS